MVSRVVIKASELHRATGKVLKRVAVENEHMVVERDGYPVAVMISYQEYERLMRDRALVEHRSLVVDLGREAERQGLTEKQIQAEIEDDKELVFRERYGKG